MPDYTPYIIIGLVVVTIFALFVWAMVSIGQEIMARDPDPVAKVASPHTVGTVPPPCGAPCGDQAQDDDLTGECSPHSGLKRAEAALDAIKQIWLKAAASPQCGDGPPPCGGGLAEKFRRTLQAQPALAGMQIRHTWVRDVYPIFCQAERIQRPPPYKDFAHELAKRMVRKRPETWEHGKRVAGGRTVYLVPDPAAVVVDLAAEKLRKRA